MHLKHFNITFGATLYKALGDDSRIRILNLLFEKEGLCVSDIERVLDFTQTKTSRHLRYLKNAGIIAQRKQDQWMIYQINEEVMEVIIQTLSFLKKDTVLTKDLNTYDILFSNRELSANKILNRNWN